MFGKKRNKKTDAEYAQMQQAGATGNSPVETRKGGTEGQEPLRSSNEPQTTNLQAPTLPKANNTIAVTPTIPNSSEIKLGRGPVKVGSKEEIGEQREQYKKAVEDAYNRQKNAVVTTEQTSIPSVKFENYVNTPYNTNAGIERVNKNAGLLKLIDDGNKLENEYKAKSEKASKQAKMAAWGNLVSAIGQLAGVGKNTYVKPENKYLTDALAKSDKAREVYEAMKLQNKRAQDEYRSKLLAQDEANHYANEKAINESIKKKNDMLIEWAKANPTKVKTVNDPNKQAEINIAQQNANANTKRAKAAMINANKDGGKSKGTPYINYQDYDTKINYNLNESEALRIAKYLIRDQGFSNETLGLKSSIVKGTIEDIKDRALLKSEVLQYIESNPKDEYVLKVLRGSKDRERSSQNKPDIDINE